MIIVIVKVKVIVIVIVIVIIIIVIIVIVIVIVIVIITIVIGSSDMSCEEDVRPHRDPQNRVRSHRRAIVASRWKTPRPLCMTSSL